LSSLAPRILAAFLLVAWGALKVPWENRMTREQRLATLGFSGPSTIALREKLGQGMALAALGGFRGLAANALMLQAHGAWEEQQWVRVRSALEMATLLQPRVALFWDLASWHLAWNAAVAAERYSGEPSETRRRIEARKWVEAGRSLLERGTKAVPEKALLFQRLGDLYWQRLADYQAAAVCYREALAKGDAPPYLERFVGYALDKAGDKPAALEYFRELRRSMGSPPDPARKPEVVEREIRKLEKEIQEGPSPRRP
jgi:tetratricopeptide (TPR) repeat protein